MTNNNEDFEIDEPEIPEIPDVFEGNDEELSDEVEISDENDDDIEENEPEIEDLDEPEDVSEELNDEIVEEDEDKHRFDYLLKLNGEELINEIRKIESEKPKFNFSKMNSKKLIEINSSEVDENTIPLYDWKKMKHFVIADVKKSNFVYPTYDESLEYPEYKKTKYIPPSGFEFIDASVELKPLGIAVVTIRTGRKKLNVRDKRFVGENVKRIEEIFVYNFEDEKWFVSKNNNEDYLRRVDITFYIETVYRSYLPRFYKVVDDFRDLTFFDSSTKVDEVFQKLNTVKDELDVLFRNSLFVLLFYNTINEKMYDFFNLELDVLVEKITDTFIFFEHLPKDDYFIHTKSFKMDIEQRETLEKLNKYIDTLSVMIRSLLSNVSLKRLNEAHIKSISSVPLHKRTDFEDMIKRGYYLKPNKFTKANMLNVFGEYQPLETLGQILLSSSKTDFPISDETMEHIQREINEYLEELKKAQAD
jgi:hypothetical protein